MTRYLAFRFERLERRENNTTMDIQEYLNRLAEIEAEYQKAHAKVSRKYIKSLEKLNTEYKDGK